MLTILANYTYRPFLNYPDKLERFVYLLLFLFPIAGMSVRHWISSLFVLLVITGLFALGRKRAPLIQEEKIFIWICVGYVAVFFISSLVNGWGDPQYRYMGTEMRFLAVIPIFLLVRNFSDCTLWLLRGAILGGFVLFGQAMYDYFILKLGFANGIYSKNIIGPLSVITAFWCLYYSWINRSKANIYFHMMIIVSVVCALIAAGMSGSRGGYVGFLVTALFSVSFFSRPRWMLVGIAVTSFVALLLYYNIGNVNHGVNKAYSEVVNYYNAEDHVTDASSKTSVGVRLEMWRTSFMMFKDNIIAGVGPENFQASTKKYVDQNLVHREVQRFESPHNAFFEALTAKGIIGLIILLLLLYYPAYIYIRDYKTYKQTAVIGLIHIVLISSFSLTDHSVIVKNNYVSILLLGMAVFLSAHLRSIRNSRH